MLSSRPARYLMDDTRIGMHPMGELVNGEWRTENGIPAGKDGAFVRGTTKFRNWITPDGSAGPSGEGGFPAAAGRYHLYVSYACP